MHFLWLVLHVTCKNIVHKVTVITHQGILAMAKIIAHLKHFNMTYKTVQGLTAYAGPYFLP